MFINVFFIIQKDKYQFSFGRKTNKSKKTKIINRNYTKLLTGNITLLFSIVMQIKINY